MTFWISALLFVTGIGAGLRVRLIARRKKAAQRQRVVELPNSHYSAPGVRRMLDLERWETIPLDRVHPVNRAEIERLLEMVRAGQKQSLTDAERTFLDVAAERHGS